MLDLEEHTPTESDGTDIVSLEEMKKHLRITSTSMYDDEITAALKEAAASLHGRRGDLNRSIFKTEWVRYLSAFPASGKIRLPYPDLIEVKEISFIPPGGDGSPSSVLDASDYVVRTVDLIPEVLLMRKPAVTNHPRAVSVRYEAGYETGEYPEHLKRLVKILAADFLQNKEASINELRQIMVNRETIFGYKYLHNMLHVPVALDRWED